MLRCLCLLIVLVGFAHARSPVVPAFDRFHSDGSAKGGRLLATELGCINCHAAPDKSLLVKSGPVLSEVGSRARVGWLRKFLSQPHETKPGTTMPNVLHNDPEAKDKIEALVHLLASTGTPKHDRAKGTAQGQKLYAQSGCAVCHGPRDASGKEGKLPASAVPLGDLVAKYTMPGLTRFLQDPTHVRTAGRMPKLLDAKQAADVGGYLLQAQKIAAKAGTGTVTYKVYEGNWDKLPDFKKLKPVAEGVGSGLDLTVVRRDNDYAITFEGFLDVKKEGRHSFTLISDDGSKVYVDGKQVVDNDGIHPPQTRKGETMLKVGVHAVRIEFFQGGGGAELEATVNGPGLRNISLGDVLSATREGAGKPAVVNAPTGDEIEIDSKLVEKGKVVFASSGCANCHTLAIKGKTIEKTMKPVADFAKLKIDKGCLADVPMYSLSATQKKALTAAASDMPAVRTPKEVVAETMTVFNCFACHSRDKVGGPTPELDKVFQTTQPEMGDEGRLPPPLDGVGAKLQTDYFKQILRDGANHRQAYMHTRMPGFGGAIPPGFVEALKSLDKLPAITDVTFGESLGKVKSAARHMTGGTAFGCIKCHTFNGIKAEGVQGIDMTLMPKRLERDWFHAYVSEPQLIRPGTRMPASFIKGKSVLPDVLDGTARQQVEAMWLYLKDGNAAQAPRGMGKKSIPLVAITTPILYRNFIEGAGARAIAVGYPEKAHLAFDANGMRIAMIWQGDFMDAGRHWSDRGVGYEPPAGDNVVKLHSGAPFAKLESADAKWPGEDVRSLGWRFKGYRLDDKERPTFQYSLGDLVVEDTPHPTLKGKDTSIVRTFALTTTGSGSWSYRAAVGNKIEALGDGAFKVDGTWTLKVTGGRVRRSSDKDELIVPVTFKDGKATVTIEYVW